MLRENPGGHLNPVVQTRVPHNIQNRSSCSGLRISRSINEAGDARMHHGSCTHGARLDGTNQCAAWQSVVPDPGCSLTEGDNFRVSCWVFIRQIAIKACANNFSVFNYQSADGYFTGLGCEQALVDGQAHPAGIVAGRLGVRNLRTLIHVKNIDSHRIIRIKEGLPIQF